MVEINNSTPFPLDEDFFKKITQKVLEGESRKKVELSIAFIDEQKIRELNKKYRNKDKTTDVLSFPDKMDFPEINTLGEIVICPYVVEKNAKNYNSTLKKELSQVLIHGILHLLGYDHEKSTKEAKRMKEKENYYLSPFFEK